MTYEEGKAVFSDESKTKDESSVTWAHTEEDLPGKKEEMKMSLLQSEHIS